MWNQSRGKKQVANIDTKRKKQNDLVFAVNSLVITDTNKLDCSRDVCNTIAETILTPNFIDEDTPVWGILEIS